MVIGLVEHDQLVRGDQRAGDCHALLLTAGELGGHVLFVAGHAHLLKRVSRALGDFLLGHLVFFHRVTDIVPDGQMRPHRIILKHNADAAAFGRDIDAFFVTENQLVIDVDIALLRLNQTAEGANQRGFSAAGRTDDAHDFPVVYGKGEILDHLLGAVADGYVFKAYTGHISLPLDKLRLSPKWWTAPIGRLLEQLIEVIQRVLLLLRQLRLVRLERNRGDLGCAQCAFLRNTVTDRRAVRLHQHGLTLFGQDEVIQQFAVVGVCAALDQRNRAGDGDGILGWVDKLDRRALAFQRLGDVVHGDATL